MAVINTAPVVGAFPRSKDDTIGEDKVSTFVSEPEFDIKKVTITD